MWRTLQKMLNRVSIPARTLSQSVLPVTSLRSVPGAGIEPAWLAPLNFKSSVYTNFTTRA